MNEDARFRSVYDYAAAQGLFSGYPTFRDGDQGAGLVYGATLIPGTSAEWRDVPRTTYGVFQIEDVPGMFRAAASYASAQGFRAAMPTFHQADHGEGVVYGTILFGDTVETREVRQADLGVADIANVPALLRAACDYAIAQGYAGGFSTFEQRDAGGSTGVVCGLVLHKPATVTQRDVSAALLALFPVPADGLLFQEEGRSEIYLIRDSMRLHIPNLYVLEALGLDSDPVQTVPVGALDHVPRDDSWEPLGGRTPGSTVFALPRVGFAWNEGRVYWPLKLPTTKRHEAWGQEIRTVELRGWIGPPGDPNPIDPDLSYHFDVDIGWLLSRGIDPSALLKVGNVLQQGEPEEGITDPRAWCSTPRIKLEISGFPPKAQWDRKKPPDWTFEIPGVVLTNDSAGAAFNQPVSWPFDPAAPLPSGVQIQGGEYVRVYGSIVSDKAHPENFPTLMEAIKQWQTGLGNNEDDDARWTEIHPPDWIEVLPAAPSLAQLLRGVTVVAPGTYPWRTAVETVLDVDIAAPLKPRPDLVLRYREFVGPETELDSLVEGNDRLTGAQITKLTNPDGIRLHVKVAGKKSFLGGSSGKFRALYWLYWDEPGPPAPTAPVGRGPHRVTCVTKKRTLGRTGIVAIGGLNEDGTRWELSLEEAIDAIEDGTRFYVELEGGRRVSVIVGRRLFRRYLKTSGDRFRSNNLLSLPSC